MAQPIFQCFALLFLFSAGTLMNTCQLAQLWANWENNCKEKETIEAGPQSNRQFAFQFLLTIVFCSTSASLYVWSPQLVGFLIFSIHTTYLLKIDFSYLLWGPQKAEYSLKGSFYHLSYTLTMVTLLLIYEANYL